jgi:anti-sigma factor RsiW
MKSMKLENSHLSAEQLLLELEGELSGCRQGAIRSHLDACWQCRTRRQEIETAIAEFIRVHQRNLNAALPPLANSRARLKACLAEAAMTLPPSNRFTRIGRWDRTLAAAAMASALLGVWIAYTLAGRWNKSIATETVVFTPDSRLTPGAATLASRQAVCAQANTKNKEVPPALRKQVFREYGIADAKPEAYEVDYLVTPALGGADDLRNLWPHSYSATWNARVKDELEDRLRDMVCSGNLDLTVAQREIAENWIAAYKKYFHTEQPLEQR